MTDVTIKQKKDTKTNPFAVLWGWAQPFKKGLVRSVVLASVGVLCSMLLYFAATAVVNGLFEGVQDYSFYALHLSYALVGIILHGVLYSAALSQSHRATFKILKHVRELLFIKLPKLSLGDIMSIPSGAIKQKIVDGVEGMERPLAHFIPEFSSNLITPLFIFIYLLVLDFRMGLLALATVPLGVYFMICMTRNYSADYQGSVAANQSMNAAVVEYIQGLEVIKTFNQDERSYAKFRDKVYANAQYYYDWMKRCMNFSSLSKEFLSSNLIAVIPVGILIFIGGSLDRSTFIATIILSLGLLDPIIKLASFTDDLAKVSTTVSEIQHIMDMPEQVHATESVMISDHQIQLEDVSFAYTAETDVLHGVSLDIEAGSLVALVGPSGSGKSTIAKLIAGFWDVDRGSVRLGGKNLRDIPLQQLYDQVAFVSQDQYLFNDTILNNIRMGQLSATDAEVKEAARRSGCDAFIRELEEGYNTVVGARGVHLSGGERQRISIARAMLKDAPVVILDEATAYIDQRMKQLFNGRSAS